MSRRNRTPEENERRAKISELLKVAKISSMSDIQDLFKETIAEFMENGLDAELDDELGYSKYDYKNKDTENSRNGHSKKTLKTSFGDIEVETPRDRRGEFEPQILKKNQTSITQDVEEKILSMYAKGMTTSDIESHIRDIYGLEVSDTTVSRITDKILPVAKEWQQRPLESIYAVVFMDAIHYHVRSEGQIVKKAVYIAIGINLDGRKDVLGMFVPKPTAISAPSMSKLFGKTDFKRMRYPVHVILMALSMFYLGKNSFRNIALILRTVMNVRVSHTTISNWCTNFAPMFQNMAMILSILVYTFFSRMFDLCCLQ